MMPVPSRFLCLLPVLAVVFGGLLSGKAGAQQRGNWNEPRVTALLEQARELRSATSVDSTFRAYSADARGFVYFFLDRPDSDERNLVKTDQIALEVYWKAPRQTRQRIVGMRDRRELPTNIQYHLDHLTVVQDDFGNQIRLGDGDEVQAVLHPVAPGSDRVYDFRLVDSLTITLPGGPVPEIRVYEVEVRPRDLDRPGVIGSVFLDRETGAIVRMHFTFTPASYVDDHLDYIRISLDNLAWEGRFWLPYRQKVEIRRELPLLDFLAGSVIRGRFEIGGYEINPELPEGLFTGPRVTAVPEQARRRFPFEEPIYARLEEEGLADIPDFERIRARAREAVEDRYLSGLRPTRLYFRNASSVLRHNRAEDLVLGAGLSFKPSPGSRVKTMGGYGFGRDRPSGFVEVSKDPAEPGPYLRMEWDAMRDLGRHPGSSLVWNSLTSLFTETDRLDPYFVSGAMVGKLWNPGMDMEIRAELSWTRIRSADLRLTGDEYRPVLRVPEGDGGMARVSVTQTAGDLTLTASGRLGLFEEREWGGGSLQLEWTRRWPGSGLTLSGFVEGALLSDRSPIHERFLLGGRHTLPGYDYRSFVGDRMTLARLELQQTVLAPWLSLRVFSALGATELRGTVPAGWPTTTTGGALTSGGAGVAFGWDVLRLDFGRALQDRPGSGWEAVFSIQKRFWPWL